MNGFGEMLRRRSEGKVKMKLQFLVPSAGIAEVGKR